jgi:hypothetical protein
MTQAPAQPGPVSSFDLAGWRWSPARVPAAAGTIAFAVALCAVRPAALPALGAALVLEVLLVCLPWRLPRLDRTGPSFWAESLCGVLGPAVALAVLAAMPGLGPLARGTAWWWYLVAAGLGAGLIACGGMRVQWLLTGQLAFAVGPTPRAQGLARAFCATVAAAGEEALFRAPVLMLSAPLSMGLLGAVGFVATHHLQPGTNRRDNTRAVVTEIAAGASLLTLTLACHSIYPAMVAHALNNGPGIALELQREDRKRNWS